MIREHLRVTLEFERLQQPAARIEAHHLRLERQGEVERLLALRELDAEGLFTPPNGERDVDGRAKDLAAAVVGGLRLRYCQLALLGRAIVLEADGQLRMAGAVEPLVKELVQVAPGRLFDRALEIGRRHVAAAMLGGVVADRLPEEVIA